MEADRNAILALLEEKKLFPRLLAQKYPHVLDSIVAAWDSPAAIDACFQDLMLADPRRKQGFPDAVMTEIFALAKFHDATYPKPASSPFDIWSRAQELSHSRPGQTDEAPADV